MARAAALVKLPKAVQSPQAQAKKGSIKMKLEMIVLDGPKALVEYVNSHNIKRENIQYIRTYSDSNWIDLIYWTEEA